uniref:Aminopeptidase N-like N-terminal domain-containing protein n=1 Tax=Ditylenchus dipsaci TaxID=166011 RepID=A0A915CXP4_9BILA
MPTYGRFAGELAEPLSVHRLARLPNDVVPIWYNLTLVTYVPGYIKFAQEKNQTFTGHLTIKVHALHSTNKIELHAKDLTVPSTGTEVFVDSSEQTDHSQNSSQSGVIKVTNVDVDNNLERVVIKLSPGLIEGNDYYVKFHYNGKILDDEQGFYYSSYIAKSDGKQRYLASTHMEPNSARYMVPCFDEPHLKATGLKQRDEDWTETTFDETPVMSSYLLAVVVSDYSYHESYVKSFNGQNIRFRVYANENDTK